eukprot:1928761-Prymnesium_polylepis.1
MTLLYTMCTNYSRNEPVMVYLGEWNTPCTPPISGENSSRTGAADAERWSGPSRVGVRGDRAARAAGDAVSGDAFGRFGPMATSRSQDSDRSR